MKVYNGRTVREFLLYNTAVGELCMIRDSGWLSQAVYIDHEDLCVCVSKHLAHRRVLKEGFEDMEFVGRDGRRQVLQVHMIDI